MSRSIRARMLAIVLIPSAALLIIGVGGASYLVRQGYDAQSWATTTGESSVVDVGIVFTQELGEERRLSLQRLGDPSVAKQLANQRNQVNASLVKLQTLGASLVKSNPGALKQANVALVKLLSQLQPLRQGVDTGKTTLQAVYTYYNQLIQIISLSLQGVAKTAPDPVTAVEETAAADLFNVAEAMSRSNALADGGVTSGALNNHDYQELSSQIGYYHTELASLITTLNPAEQASYAQLIAGPDWRAVNTMESFLLLRGPQSATGDGNGNGGGSLPMTVQDWQSTATQVHNQLLGLYAAQHQYASGFAKDTGHRTFVNSLIGGGLIVLLTLIAAFVAARLSNRLVNRLRELRAKTLELADTQLPHVVSRLRSGEQIDIDHEVPPLRFGGDEIGQVADAFNKAQHTAVAAAAQEARTREGVNAVFLNIAHRSQVVVHRQLEVLDRAERKQEDPDELELLFQLDHLATRARRNAENLIILGGERPGRKWRNPVPLNEIVRSAVGETEQYKRVDAGRLPEVSVAGAVVADLVHLLAELVDNATSFSPQDSRVEIRGNMVGKGVVVEVEDQGLGLADKERELINGLLHEPPDFGVMALSNDSRLGLFVVSQLAARHGINVTLVESVYGGVRAIVLVRASLLARESNGDTPENGAGDPSVTAELPRQRHQPGRLRIADPVSTAKPAHKTGELTIQWPTSEHTSEKPPMNGNGNGVIPQKHQQQGHQQQAGGRHGRQQDARQPDSTVPPLPRRRRQANLSPQLVGDADPGPSNAVPSDAESVRMAEQARDTMAAFQHGTRQARDAR
ncbi:MAG TPA: nitrate- and nitrite sensing domain-containing protein [Pseudonocardiaceae bacterium]|nr:nitrate- and nitrite sensing domain-containing protein [Pseudonocardiaceae bacterium]